MTTPASALGRLARVDPGASYGVTTPFTTSDVLTNAQSGLWCTTDGALVTVVLEAPAVPDIGDTFTLHRTANYPFRFKPDAAHSVHGGAVGKYVELLEYGTLTFEYTAAGYWTITRDACLWTWEL